MYIARFRGDDGEFLTAALKRQSVGGTLVHPDLRRLLQGVTNLDVAIRIACYDNGLHSLLILSADAGLKHKLQNTCNQILQTCALGSFVAAQNADDFDNFVGNLPPFQFRVKHDGYRHAGYPLACDFLLYPLLTGRYGAPPIAYQVHLKSYRPQSETERRVRKYIAWLNIDRPFSERVRSMQRLLAHRLLQAGTMASEFLAVGDRETLDGWLNRIEETFRETTGRSGFQEAPLEVGDFTDWLMTGRHPASTADSSTGNIPGEGARLRSSEEIALLLSTQFASSFASDGKPTEAAKIPDVFISYAAADYAFASSACAELEDKGLVCWIAPRDINSGILPYPEAIIDALRRVKALVVFLSDAANLSVHIPRELDIALEQKLTIVPVRVQDVAPTGQLNYLLRTCQWLNAFNRPQSDACDELIKRLQRLST